MNRLMGGYPAQTIDKKLATLQDKDERKPVERGYQQYQSEYPSDNVFFSE
ncbi:hypothetical protein [Arsenophonus endosymbiont of Aleurodicus floccissimus]|nr:hypothetical protein [Arsenophonus endosymbiont of Aleurodicus floccissimus]